MGQEAQGLLARLRTLRTSLEHVGGAGPEEANQFRVGIGVQGAQKIRRVNRKLPQFPINLRVFRRIRLLADVRLSWFECRNTQ